MQAILRYGKELHDMCETGILDVQTRNLYPLVIIHMSRLAVHAVQ